MSGVTALLALLAAVITAPIVATNAGTWTGSILLLVVVAAFSALSGKRQTVQGGLSLPPPRPNQLWFFRTVWAFVNVAVFVLVTDAATTERWPVALIGASVAVIVFSGGLALWSEVPESQEVMQDGRKYGVILTSVAIIAGVYVVANTPTLSETASIKAAVSTALGAVDTVAATPGPNAELAALSDEQLDQKYSAAETWLRSLFTGPPLERALLSLSSKREIEQSGPARYVSGGSKVTDWTSIRTDGDMARVTGRNTRWLDTAVPDKEGHYTVHPSPPAHYTFTIDLKKSPEGSWTVTEYIASREGGH
ncbi:hypothetical protein LQL77_23035 [Rhodococcus cerastii]|nr:hypothetical protein [Rhodococcus cerastii]